MKRRWLALLPFLLFTACTVEAPQPVVPINPQTAQALTPQPTATSTIAPTVAPSPTLSPTATTTPITPTVEASAAAATPEETAQPAADVAYCRREFGPVDSPRFSARLTNVRTEQTDQFEQVIFEFADLSGELHGNAACTIAAAWPTDLDIGAPQAPGDAVIQLDLADWAHDDLFAASPITETVAITGSGVVQRVSFAANSLDSRGALLGVGLAEPRPFRVRVQDASVIVEVARDDTYPPTDDALGVAAGTAPALSRPIYFLHENDVYRLQDGQAQPVKQTPELEIGLAVSPDGSQLAVCRAPVDAEPFALPYGVRATLWTMRADGSDEQQLADVGGCAEPSFANSGRTIAFTANIAPTPPVMLQVWTVPVVGGDAMPVTTALDEWSRSQPRWLADGRLVYRATNDGGQTIIFVRADDGAEREITAQLLTGSTYANIGDFVVDPSSDQVALEALRTSDGGADLVVLRADGTQVAAEKRGFWQRPLAFVEGELIYLSAECPSDTVLSYTLRRRTANGAIENVVQGSTAALLGAATLQDNVLVYVRGEASAPGLRGPAQPLAMSTPSAIWGFALDGSAGAELWSDDGAITLVQAARN